MKKIYSSLLVLSSAFYFGQQIDAKTHEINFAGDSYPAKMIKLGNKLIFEASDHAGTKNLYGYDYVTKQKNKLVSSFSNSRQTEDHFQVKVNDNIFLLRARGSGWELWKTDGTPGGTQRQVTLDSSVGNITEFIYYQGKFYFIADKTLWVSNGTPAGTFILKTFNTVLSAPIALDGLTPFKNRVYFGASDELVNKEVWSTDGTVEGTVQFTEIHPTYSSIDSKFKAVEAGGFLYFAASDDNSSYALWKTDGSAAGTIKVKQFDYFYSLTGTAYQNKLIFSGSEAATGHELWISDGTPGGTHIIKDATPGSASTFDPTSSFLFNFNGEVYYTSNKNDSQGNFKMEIWKTDGTPQGTVHVNDIDNVLIQHAYISSEGKNLIFNNTSVSSDFRYFIFDRNGKVTPIERPVFAGNYSYIDLNENELVFSVANDPQYGTEPFIYNKPDKTYTNLADINSSGSADPKAFFAMQQGELIFQATDKRHGREFYKMPRNGTPELLKDLYPNNGFTMPTGELLKIGNYLYVKMMDSYDVTNEIIRTDGTAAHTEIVSVSEPININGDDLFANLNDQALLFTSNSYLPKSKFYRLDNDTKVLTQIAELKLGIVNGQPAHRKSVSYNDEIYFLVNDDNKNVVYKTGGTSSTTAPVLSFTNSDDSDGNPILLGTFNGKLFLSKNKEKWERNVELYSYDASTGVVQKEREYEHQNEDEETVTEEITAMAVSNDTMYVLTRYGNNNTLYGHNAAGSTIVQRSGTGHSYIDAFQCGNNTYLQTGYDARNISQVIHTNGDIAIASSNAWVKDLKCINNYMYYLHGNNNKIGRSNGNADENIWLTPNITNAPQVNNDHVITALVSAGDKLHFVANTGESGTELYSITTELPIYLRTNEISGATRNMKLVLYPNPASDFINIKSSAKMQPQSYRVFDISGKQLLHGSYHQKEIDISRLSSGLYIIEVVDGTGTAYSQKFIKK